jgi:hypothetical protein
METGFFHTQALKCRSCFYWRLISCTQRFDFSSFLVASDIGPLKQFVDKKAFPWDPFENYMIPSDSN